MGGYLMIIMSVAGEEVKWDVPNEKPIQLQEKGGQFS